MSKKDKAYRQLLAQKLLPLFYHNSPEISLRITSSLYQAGIRMIEYTARGVNALENFQVLKKESERNFKDLQIGIGT
ncbi:MAG TPA: hypothetical protein VGO09_00375, partial [Flavisolibacter sp.]|nr:hypothetical protein [Flavisolibacter sp.]